MDDLHERLSASTIDHLISDESNEIKKLEDQLSTRRLKLFALEMLNRKLSYSKTDSLWSEFLAELSKESPELSLLLQQVVLISLEPGKLILRASETRDGELLRLRRNPIQAALQKHFRVNFSLEVLDE